MTDKTDIAALLTDMRELAERIVECQGENSDGEEIIDLYDLSDTTFKAQNILLVLGAFEAERQQRKKAEAELAALRGEQEPVAWKIDSEIPCHNVVTLSEVVAKSWVDKGRIVAPLFRERQPKPVVVLPKLHFGVVQDGHAVMIPYSGGHWLNKTAVIESLEAAGIVVKDGE